MMDETLALIQRLANERHDLYRLAGKQHLTLEEHNRLDELNAQLPVVWDQYRREFASLQWTRTRPIEQRRAA